MKMKSFLEWIAPWDRAADLAEVVIRVHNQIFRVLGDGLQFLSHLFNSHIDIVGSVSLLVSLGVQPVEGLVDQHCNVRSIEITLFYGVLQGGLALIALFNCFLYYIN